MRNTKQRRILEKAFDRELRDVLWWTLRKLGMEKWLVKIPQSIYRNARSHGIVTEIFSGDFLDQVGLH